MTLEQFVDKVKYLDFVMYTTKEIRERYTGYCPICAVIASACDLPEGLIDNTIADSLGQQYLGLSGKDCITIIEAADSFCADIDSNLHRRLRKEFEKCCS